MDIEYIMKDDGVLFQGKPMMIESPNNGCGKVIVNERGSSMEKYFNVDIDTARRWYNSDDELNKSIALRFYSEDELKGLNKDSEPSLDFDKGIDAYLKDLKEWSEDFKNKKYFNVLENSFNFYHHKITDEERENIYNNLHVLMSFTDLCTTDEEKKREPELWKSLSKYINTEFSKNFDFNDCAVVYTEVEFSKENNYLSRPWNCISNNLNPDYLVEEIGLSYDRCKTCEYDISVFVYDYLVFLAKHNIRLRLNFKDKWNKKAVIDWLKQNGCYEELSKIYKDVDSYIEGQIKYNRIEEIFQDFNWAHSKEGFDFWETADAKFYNWLYTNE